MQPNFNIARGTLDELTRLIEASAPSPNPQLLHEIKCHCASIGIADPYIQQNVGRIQSRAEVLLSTRKWQDHTGGAEGARRDALGAIVRVREQIEYLELGRDS